MWSLNREEDLGWGSGAEGRSFKKEGGPVGCRRLRSRTEEGCCIL